jgi:hypothetical protein
VTFTRSKVAQWQDTGERWDQWQVQEVMDQWQVHEAVAECHLRGLLDRSTARYFYHRIKTCLHKHTGNLVENLFYRKCTSKNYLQPLLEKFLSQTTTTL